MKIWAYAAAAVLLTNGGAYAQSAKFSADWAKDEVTLASAQVAACEFANMPCNDTDENLNVQAAELVATMKVPQNKEVLIGLSGEASLVTFTQAKGKNGGGEITASAEASMTVTVKLAPTDYEATVGVCVDDDDQIIEAAPGPVNFASRKQDLSISVSGFENADSLVGEVSVALRLSTVAAHHFNFVAYDLTSDEYDIYACFGGKAVADVFAAAGATDGSGSANAAVAIKKRILTVQQVRAVKDEFIDAL